MSNYFDQLINILSIFDTKAEYFDKDANLALSCFQAIDNLISYSSHDKQQKISTILVEYVLKVSNLNNNSTSDIETKKELLSYYVRLIRTIILKFVTTLKIEDAKNIYNVIIQSFEKIGIYDEGILALSSIAISMILN